MLLENLQRHDFQRALMRRAKNHGRRFARLSRFQPTARTQAPPVAGFKSGKLILRARRYQIISRRQI
jgi:membrane protein DedA with SNARE-associated domain